MKKFILSLFSLAAITTGAKAQIAFGPEVGLNVSNYSTKVLGSDVTTDMRYGARAGVMASFDFNHSLYLQPGLFYVMNGYKMSDNGDDTKIGVSTIELPINLIYKFGAPGKNRFFVGVGPYVALNVGGKVEESGTISESRSIKIGSDTSSDIKAFDFGAGVNVGYQFINGLFIRAHYQMGFVNLFPNGDANNTLRNYNFGLSVGYEFSNKKVKANPSKM